MATSHCLSGGTGSRQTKRISCNRNLTTSIFHIQLTFTMNKSHLSKFEESIREGVNQNKKDKMNL